MKKHIKPIQLHLLILFLSVNPIFAKQLDFKKENHNSKKKFTYLFLDSQKKKQSLSFSLSADLIENSYREIPSLEFIRRNISSELSSRAYQIAQQYLAPLEEKYQKHLKKTRNTISESTSKLGAGFEIKMQCPEKILQYKFQFKRISQLTYSSKVSVQGCSLSAKSKAAYRKLVQNWNTLKTNELREEANEEYKKKHEVLIREYKKIRKMYQGFHAEFQILSSPIFKKISQKITSSSEKKYYKYYLKINKKETHNTIILDYHRLVKDYIQRMQIVSSAIKQQNLGARNLIDRDLSDRELIELTLNFLQSIPYNTLEDRGLGTFAGFLPAYALLDKNIGDCDSKSVAMLSITKTLTPEIKSIMILISKHAFLAYAVPLKKGDTTVLYQGERYVVAEAAGPSVRRLGHAGKNSARAIRKKRFEEILTF